MKNLIGTFVIARCRDAGVHVGFVESTDEHHTVLTQARRIWYWSGAASLSEIAVYGINPEKIRECKIAASVPAIRLRDSDICELIVCTKEGKISVFEAPTWRA